jgi:hypothetical protein
MLYNLTAMYYIDSQLLGRHHTRPVVSFHLVFDIIHFWKATIGNEGESGSEVLKTFQWGDSMSFFSLVWVLHCIGGELHKGFSDSGFGLGNLLA